MKKRVEKVLTDMGFVRVGKTKWSKHMYFHEVFIEMTEKITFEFLLYQICDQCIDIGMEKGKGEKTDEFRILLGMEGIFSH